MTPAQRLGYSEGQKFRVKDTDHRDRYVGKIVTLVNDDDSSLPYFELEDGNTICVNLEDIAPVGEEVKTAPGFMVETSKDHTLFRVNRQLTTDEVKSILDIIGG